VDAPVKLYYSPYSVTSRAVQLLLEAMNIKHESIVIDLGKGEQLTEAYLKVNPNGLVPTIVDSGFGGLTLFETPAILRHLVETRAGGSKYYPEDAKLRAQIDSAMDWLNTSFYREYGYHHAYIQLFDHHRHKDDAVNKAVVNRSKEKSQNALKILDGMIGQRNAVVGDSVTIADFWLAGLISIGDLVGNTLESYPNIRRWRGVSKQFKGYETIFAAHNASVPYFKEKVISSIH